MDEIERLRTDVMKAESDLKMSRRFAEMDRESAADKPTMTGFHHDRNAERVRICEERLREARARLDTALAIR